MRGGGKSMRSTNQPLSEMTIKVPGPFAGISDLGFTAQYRSQHFQEPLRDCAETARLRLADVIEMRVSTKSESIADIVLPLDDIVRSNGDRLLWQLAG